MFLVMITMFTLQGFSASFFREVCPYSGGAGTSTVSMCNTSLCTSPMGLNQGMGFSNTMTGLTVIYITFDYAFYPGSVTTWTISPGSVSSFGYTMFPIGTDELYIKKNGTLRDDYSYFVRTWAL